MYMIGVIYPTPRLHYRLTTTCMLAFSIVVSASQYVGNPIDCIHTNDIPEDVVNTYCWIHSTYTIPRYTHTISLQYPYILYDT